MKPLILNMVLVVMLMLFSATVFAGEKYQDTDWTAFSINLKNALNAENEGLKRSALQQIIRYHDCLDVKEAAIAILHIYRSHPDFQTRRLALTALPKTNSNYAIGYLRLAVEYEDSPILKKQILFILKDS